MVDIENIKPIVIERLKTLNPDKIILFGSYAYGKPNEDSDIDLLLIKDIAKNEARNYKLKARKIVRELISKYKVSFDFVVASENFIQNADDYFYKNEILKKGKVWYE